MSNEDDPLLSLNYSDLPVEIEVVDVLRSLNFSIDLVVCTILDKVKKAELVLCPPELLSCKLNAESSIPLRCLLIPVLSNNTRIEIVELVLGDIVCSTVHKFFFQGDNFLAVGSESLRLSLEHLLAGLGTAGVYFNFIYFNFNF